MVRTQSPASAAGEVEFYSSPGPMTDLRRCPAALFQGLPLPAWALCHVVQGLLVHEEWAPAYGLELTDERRQEVRTRPAAAMVEVIRRLDPAPLATARPPERRMVGNCRHFATFATALLRRAGIPARARCGFASYFESTRMVDHWVTEYFSAEKGRWIRIDPQLDTFQREVVLPDFDPDDMAAGSFLPAGDAWRACRDGVEDPARFGIFDMWGLWFIHNNVVRDLAALNKWELLPWDSWGPMAFGIDPDPAASEAVDRISSSIASGDTSKIRRIYDESEGLSVPSTVFDGRFGVQQDLDLSIWS